YLDATGFKPRAGNDYWHDYDDFRDASQEGRLYGKDAKKIAKVSNASVTPEEINPIHRLWQPLHTPKNTVLGEPGREFLLDRVGQQLVVNENASMPQEVTDTFNFDSCISVASLQELESVVESRYLEALNALGTTIRQTSPAVIESYEDIARPIRDIDIDVVAVVESGSIQLFEGERYQQACSVLHSRGRGLLEKRVGDIIDALDPVATYQLTPISQSKRNSPSAIANTYQDTYVNIQNIADNDSSSQKHS
ncbi:MAG: ATPase, partial [Halobacteriaceae archaeon]